MKTKYILLYFHPPQALVSISIFIHLSLKMYGVFLKIYYLKKLKAPNKFIIKSIKLKVNEFNQIKQSTFPKSATPSQNNWTCTLLLFQGRSVTLLSKKISKFLTTKETFLFLN
jgi:hypothetical protein